MNRALRLFSLRMTSMRLCSRITKVTPSEVTKENAQFDEVTHTGQAWDQADYRLQRFDISKKQVNPNIAMNLIAERPAIDCGTDTVMYCDGGHPPLGHPRVYLNLQKPGIHACGYCGNRYYNSHVTKGEDMKIEHLNC